MTVLEADSDMLPCYRADLPALTRFASALAGQLEAGDVVLLYGTLGAGKTTLTQLVARALQVPDEDAVSSPSFALVHEYRGRLPLCHMDLYRLSGEEEVEDSGLLEYFDGDAVVLVEWPERLGNLIPPERLEVLLDREHPGGPALRLRVCGAFWLKRLPLVCSTLIPFPAHDHGGTRCS